MRPNQSIFKIVSLITCFLALSCSGAENSYRGLRYSSVIGQTTWYTCGPAALATLFTYYYGAPVSEQEFTTLTVNDLASRGKNANDGVTLLSLRNASRTKGMDATGYKLTPDALREMLKSGLPILANVVQPEDHFTVVIGIEGDSVLTADPSWGFKVQPMRQFLDAWNGVVLVPAPSKVQEASAKAQVAKVLAAYRERRTRLKSGL